MDFKCQKCKCPCPTTCRKMQICMSCTPSPRRQLTIVKMIIKMSKLLYLIGIYSHATPRLANGADSYMLSKLIASEHMHPVMKFAFLCNALTHMHSDNKMLSKLVGTCQNLHIHAR